MHAGETKRGLNFTLLDKRDMSPIGYRKINKNSGEEVAARDIVKGYRYDDRRYVTLTEEDFARASPERTQRLDIQAFVTLCDIDPAHFERPYWLEPEPKSVKAYALLREALRAENKCGIATFVLRAKQHLAAVYAHGPALAVELLRYEAELRGPEDLHLPPEDAAALKLSPAELQMARRLVAENAGSWKPSAFRDSYHDDLLAFIAKKAKAGRLEEAAPVPDARGEAPESGDIMDLLRRSLAHGAKAGAR